MISWCAHFNKKKKVKELNTDKVTVEWEQRIYALGYFSWQFRPHHLPSPQWIQHKTQDKPFTSQETHIWARVPVEPWWMRKLIETSNFSPNVKWIFNCKCVCFPFPGPAAGIHVLIRIQRNNVVHQNQKSYKLLMQRNFQEAKREHTSKWRSSLWFIM